MNEDLALIYDVVLRLGKLAIRLAAISKSREGNGIASQIR